VLLQGGLELGLGRGTELRTADTAKGNALHLRVVDVAGMGMSAAVAIAGRANTLKSGALMVVDKWVEPDRPALRVWISAPLDAAALKSARSALAALQRSTSLEWVNDPSTLPDDGRPLYVVRPA